MGFLDGVFKKKEGKFGDYPLPLVLDGEIQEDTVKQIKKDSKWIKKTLESEGVKLADVFYAFYKEKSLFIIKQSDLNR